MDSLPEKNEAENESTVEGSLSQEEQKNSKPTQPAVTKQPTVAKTKKQKQTTAAGRHNKEQQVKKGDGQPVGCIPLPYFGIKHYLHNFYGVPETSREAKMWRQFELNEDDYIAILAAGQGTNEEECWACHRRCFAWSITLGALILVTGITCLMLGFILPRQPILLTTQVEENDLKLWIASHSEGMGSMEGIPRAALNIVDHAAVEHNNTLDILKVGGMMSTCLGVLLLVCALIFPPSSGDPSTWVEEANTPHMSQVNEAFKNCFRSINCKKNDNSKTGLVATTAEEKIPALEQVKSVQPAQP